MEFCYRLSFISQARLPLVRRIFTTRSFGRASPQALGPASVLEELQARRRLCTFSPASFGTRSRLLRRSSASSVCLGRGGDVERPTVGGGTSEPTRKTGGGQKTERGRRSQMCKCFYCSRGSFFSSATVWLRFRRPPAWVTSLRLICGLCCDRGTWKTGKRRGDRGCAFAS